MRRSPAAALLFGALLCPALAADRPAAKPAADLPEVKGLPNPFTFADNTPVKSKDDWGRRRDELKGLFQDYVYGIMPPKPDKMTVKRDPPVVDDESKVTLQNLELKLEHAGKSLTLKVRVARPSAAAGKVPVVVQSGFGGGKGGAAPTGKRFVAFTTRGFAVAECNFQEAAADNKDRALAAGVYQLYGETMNCGGLMAWAWCVSRAIDALADADGIDVTKVVVTGHSRYGKAALLAGAFDERIAVTVPSHSGCAGAAPFRLIYGKSEQLQNIAGFAPHWFRPDFNQFVGKVDRLPVDQHELIALVAPRAVLLPEGTQDAWTNPEGVQQAHAAAKAVFDFLGAGDRLGVRYRPVGHVPSNDDLMDFADFVFARKKLSDDFGKLPYKADPAAFTWAAPK